MNLVHIFCNSFFSEYTGIDIGWGLCPRTPTPSYEKLATLARPHSWFKTGRFLAGEEWKRRRKKTNRGG